MQYSRKGNLHRLIRITGPSHNLLGIEFGGINSSECVVERLGKEPSGLRLKDEDVKAWVLKAVADANAEFGTNLVIRRIQYVAGDTLDRNAYFTLARELVRIQVGR